ncbi:MAG: phosphopantothenoylcysteine decarboxylase [Planctomycetes bacterium]|nr:phosphopantothenoylcysteine decarboxylase [Planctomycetota bacterium]
MDGREIAVGVTGGIAAYKAAALVSRLVQAGAAVTVVMTEAATRFVGPLTFQTLTGRPAYTDLWSSPEGFRSDHVALADRAELVVVAPATADCLGKLAHGIADDMLSTFLLAIDVPLILAPAMNCRMWAHPAVRANVETLRTRGVRLVGPAEGRLACGTAGTGRMAEPEDILAAVLATLSHIPDRP